MMDQRPLPRRDVLTPEEADRVADVFTTHYRFVEAVARQHAPSQDHVPDIVQAVGVKICLGLNGFRNEAEITTWLYRVTVNAARDCYQQEQWQQRRAEGALTTHPAPDVIEDPDQVIQHGERLQALYDGVQRLKSPYREALCHELGQSSVLLNRKTRQRARQQLRELLADDPRLEDE